MVCADPEARMPAARVPEEIKLFAVGGAERHSLVSPGRGTRSHLLAFDC